MVRNDSGAYCPEGALLNLRGARRNVRSGSTQETRLESMEETRLAIESSEIGSYMEGVDDENCVLV